MGRRLKRVRVSCLAGTGANGKDKMKMIIHEFIPVVLRIHFDFFLFNLIFSCFLSLKKVYCLLTTNARLVYKLAGAADTVHVYS